MLPPDTEATQQEVPVAATATAENREAAITAARQNEFALPFEYIVIHQSAFASFAFENSEEKDDELDLWNDDGELQDNSGDDDIADVMEQFKTLSARTESTTFFTESDSVVSSLHGFASVKSIAKRAMKRASMKLAAETTIAMAADRAAAVSANQDATEPAAAPVAADRQPNEATATTADTDSDKDQKCKDNSKRLKKRSKSLKSRLSSLLKLTKKKKNKQQHESPVSVTKVEA